MQKIDAELIWTRRVRLFAAVCAAAVGFLVLVGWATDSDILKRIHPDLTAMNPLTALCFILSGIALASHTAPKAHATALLGSTILVLSLLKLMDLLLVSIPIDRALFATSLIGTSGAVANSMAPNTTVAFLFIGLAILFAPRRQKMVWLSQGCAGVVLLISMFALIGYGFGMNRLNTVGLFIPMALHTAVVLLIVSLGLLALRPYAGIMLVLRDRGSAGSMARTVLPLAILVPIAVGAARLWGQQQGYYGTEAGVALQVIANVLVTSALLISSVVALYHSDTARRRREQALSRSEEQYKLAERVASVGHWRMELPSLSLHWSDEMFRMCGIAKETGPPSAVESLGIYHPDDRDRVRQSVRAALNKGCNWEDTVRLCRPDGELRHIVSQGVCEHDGDGKVTDIFGVFADVTELERARREAEAATMTKAAFLANMSHEIRTPLNGVIGFAELLIAGELKPEQKRHATLIFESAQALLKLLNDILDVSKIDAGQLEVTDEPFDLGHQLRQCVRLMSSTAEKKGLELSLTLDPNLPQHINSDGLRLRQVVLNLLGNAVKFTNRGSVTVDASRQVGPHGEPLVQISVADTGVGIPEERQAWVFEQFVQADATISRRFGGSGLGLSISRKLIELMGGTIALESREGAGTRVTVTLPLSEVAHPMRRSSDALGDTPVPTAAHANRGQAAHILLVEDLDINQELITDMLGRLGHSVEVASNGAEAIRIAGRLSSEPDRYNLILMDVQMPLVDGLEATRAIRKLGGRASEIPIVALTANAYSSEIEECRASGMDDHIAKPVSMATLEKALSHWLNSPRRRRAEDRASAPLADKFAQRLKSYAARLTEIETSLAGATEEARAMLLAEAGAMAHNLAGTAAIFGRPSLGELAAAVEDGLEEDVGTAAEQIADLLSALKRAA